MTRKKALKTIITLVSLLIVGLSYTLTQKQPANTPAPPPGHYQIANFSDGDTFTVIMNGQEERIRLIGVDTPETKKPNSPVQCYGPEASRFTKDRAHEQSVRLEADPIGNNRDRYDRLLRYAYLPDGTLLNELLIREGYGFAYLSFPFSKQAEFAAAQADAQSAKRGLWANCAPKQNDGRWQSNNL